MKTKSDTILNFFEKSIPAYYQTEIIRTSQLQMALDVANFLQPDNNEKIFFVEAPVGTGKSLGALIPSLVEAKENKRRVVYATATINLQGQLMNSEVPLLKKLKLLKSPILAKGKGHYYCHKEFVAKKKDFTPKDESDFLSFFKQANTGQRNELEDEFGKDVSEITWNKIALKATKRECDRCDYSLSCPTNTHRGQFMSLYNDLVITNHDQLIRSVLNQTREPYSPSIIPTEPGIIIIDEAHHFQENFLGQIEESVTLTKLNSLIKYVNKSKRAKYNGLLKELKDTLLKDMEENEASFQGRYPISPNVLKTIAKVNKLVKEALSDFTTEQAFKSYYSEKNDTDEIEEVSYILENLQGEEYVSWINYDEMKFSAISRTFPSEFRKLLRYLSNDNKIIVMSGTLTTNGDFDSVIKQWRLTPKEVVAKSFETPFDYANQSLIYIPEDICEPKNNNYLDECSKNIDLLIRLTKGRSLILTTAKDHINKLEKKIEDTLNELDINLLVQDQSGVEKLTKDFKSDETSVLIGSGSFFSGFSVPGQSLISVCLIKLPFPVPDDPFLELIGEGYDEDEFFDLIIFPHMINKLNQAAGRLIRDIEDFGVFSILDPRVFSKKYGAIIREVLNKQGYRITRSYNEVEAFIGEKLEKGSEAQYKGYTRDDLNIPKLLMKPMVKKSIKKEALVVTKKIERNKITEKQKEYAKMICRQEGKPLRKNLKTPEQLFEYLINIFCIDGRSDLIIRSNFPYQSEAEKEKLLKMKGTTNRNYVAPNCRELFGCSGECNLETKKIIEDNFYENGAKEVKFYHSQAKKHCIVVTSPITIISQPLVSKNNH